MAQVKVLVPSETSPAPASQQHSPQEMGSSSPSVQSLCASQTLLSGIQWLEPPHWNSPSLHGETGLSAVQHRQLK